MVGETEIIDPDEDFVAGFACSPQYAEHIEALKDGETPFRADKGNVLHSTVITAVRVHDSLAEAAAYLLGLTESTPRAGDVEMTIDPTGTEPVVYEMDAALVRVTPGSFVGGMTTVTFTILSGVPTVAAEPEE